MKSLAKLIWVDIELRTWEKTTKSPIIINNTLWIKTKTWGRVRTQINSLILQPVWLQLKEIKE